MFLVACRVFEGLNLWSNLPHSDWSKFEMERSDWSCAYCRQGAPREIPDYRSNVEHFLIGRKHFHHQGALRVNYVDGSDWSRAVTWPMTSQLFA